jgi:hypothetical protein
MRRREVLKSCLLAGASLGRVGFAELGSSAGEELGVGEDRAAWVAMLDRVAGPVLGALSERRLKASMPVEAFAGREQDRRKCTYLEALGRTLAGIAPWLENGARSGAEGKLRERYCEMARQAIAAGVDKGSPDYLDFGGDRQTIVDAAFLALAVVRAPQELREKLPMEVRKQLAAGLRATRGLLAGFNNWLLFAAMIEACLFTMGEDWDRERVDYALREHQSWYLGDGTYGDGPHFHWDYYNSFVIQPFLLNLMDGVAGQEPVWAAMKEGIVARARRYASVQERMIAPDGTYPVVGRSIAYRCGAFQLLGEMALREKLPEGVAPAQVRGAMTAVMRRTLMPAGTFDARGWLRIGLAGHQPSIGEPYISTGSLYLCTAVFLPLGLPAQNAFWSGAPTPWSSVKAWRGDDVVADHAVDG